MGRGVGSPEPPELLVSLFFWPMRADGEKVAFFATVHTLHSPACILWSHSADERQARPSCMGSSSGEERVLGPGVKRGAGKGSELVLVGD